VLSEGEIKVTDKITPRRVALVQSLGYNLLSVSQLLDERFEVLFRPGSSRILDSREDLVYMVVPEGQVFRADFSQSSGGEHCFLAGSLLTDKRRIPLRSASVQTPHLFHHGIPKVLVNPRSKGITSVQSTSTH
jgi:hypothetical protein